MDDAGQSRIAPSLVDLQVKVAVRPLLAGKRVRRFGANLETLAPDRLASDLRRSSSAPTVRVTPLPSSQV